MASPGTLKRPAQTQMLHLSCILLCQGQRPLHFKAAEALVSPFLYMVGSCV